ncbi:ParB/RepB/Spo0J family partition protein [Pseudonocardia dioxanivorans]|uniref:ParB/RepB/Spo0J family partition protein n=1 Tax=Pseudonocardia dioxanivorans TaxID=240495 RepID=UPI000CD2BE07|nr:ParB/RepB/Spo0J family partition protein [Pseudonocardia dioxanivorans]
MHAMLTLHVDELVDLERDLRGDRGEVEGLAVSIIELGLLEPLIVVPDGSTGAGGRYVIHAGHRRRDAILRACALLAADPQRFDLTAEQAGARIEVLQQVPCFVRPDLAGRDALTQIAENGERLGLTDAERARGLQMALDDGLDIATIVRATGVKPATVRAAQKVAALPEAAREALDSGQVGLDEVAALDEFADDEKALARILRSSHVEFAVAEERRKRQRAADTVALRQRLADEGYTIVKRPKDFPYSSRETELDRLSDEDGQTLTVDEHGKLDGHAVFIDAQHYGGPAAVHICTDPEAHGHTRRVRNGYVSPAEAAAKEAEAQLARERAEQMAAAREVRAKFLRSLIGSQKAAAKHLDLLCTITARWPSVLDDAHRHPYAGQLRGEVESWTPGRLQQHAVATAVLAIDWIAEGGRRWRIDEDAALWWWQRLAELGYDLTPAEIAHRDRQQVSRDERRAAEAAEEAAMEQADELVDDPDPEDVDTEDVDLDDLDTEDAEDADPEDDKSGDSYSGDGGEQAA